ncbi:MAG: OmpH family outer membrane protein [Bacteroidia bacterium]|nr:OmpH family outer membrane protein [Bacteroidia bacterium]
MKSKLKIIFIALVALFTLSNAAEAQRIAVVDITEVLNSLDEYTAAQADLDATAEQWRQEIAKEQEKISSLYNAYQTEQVLLSEDAKVKKENEIIELEKKVRELQRKRFGPEGDLFRKQEDLVTPIQQKVFNTIEDYASERGYDFILDKGGSTGILFANPRMDKTVDIINRLNRN